MESRQVNRNVSGSSVAKFLALMKIVPRNPVERQQCEQLYLQFSSEVHDRLYKAVTNVVASMGLEEAPPKLGANMKMILARSLRKLMTACLSGRMSFLTASNLVAQGQIYFSVVNELEKTMYGEKSNNHFVGLLNSLEDSKESPPIAKAS
ncbi:hypothetical protein P7F88_10615 [Vibrio hannami]|uniref:hypothetical protein n=1 Tax=Vibrio hannami TaxID=2717094 RepID=UPI00241079A1|nr:hypothetical protein [Vibrio hannami]MDG3086541.1 hypothetical protein [Vibrio hannami]